MIDLVERTPDLVVRHLGHSAFLLRSAAGTRLVLDPFDNEEDAPPWFAHPFPQIQCDLLAMTHGHFDHSAEHRVTVVGDTLRSPGEISMGDVRVRGIADVHARGGGDNMIVVVEAADTRFVHIGDNRAEIPSEIVDEIGAVDMLAVHVDDTRYFLEFEDVDRVIKAFRPGVVVPIHHRQPEISAEGTEVGPCHEWLATQRHVRRRSGEVALDRKTFPDETEVWVLQPLPGSSTGPVVVASEPAEPEAAEPTEPEQAESD